MDLSSRSGTPHFQRRELVVDGRTLSYRVAGSGPVVVLVHGLFSSGASWVAVAERLRGRFTVIAPDLPGHGDSTAPTGADASLGAHTAAVRVLLDCLGHGRVTLVGHSMGGGVAMNFAGAFPSRVERLVLLSSGGLGREVSRSLRLAATPGASFVIAPLASRPACALLRACARGLAPWHFGAGPALALVRATDMLSGLRTRAKRRAALATLRAVVGPGGQRGLCGQRRMLELEGIPTLFVWGSADHVVPLAHGVAAHHTHRSSSMLVLDGAGHHLQESRPAAVAGAVVAFAARPAPGAALPATRVAGGPPPRVEVTVAVPRTVVDALA